MYDYYMSCHMALLRGVCVRGLTSHWGMTLVLISSYCAFWRYRGRCPQRPSGPSIIQSQSRYAVAATPQNNTELACGQRTDVGICPYNVFATQNTEKSGHSLPPYGVKNSPLLSPKFRLVPHAFLVGYGLWRSLCKAWWTPVQQSCTSKELSDARRFSSRVHGGTGEM